MTCLTRWIARLTGPCILWHVTRDRLTHTADQEIWYTCTACDRVTSICLKNHPKGEKIAPATAVKANWFDGIRRRA